MNFGKYFSDIARNDEEISQTEDSCIVFPLFRAISIFWNTEYQNISLLQKLLFSSSLTHFLSLENLVPLNKNTSSGRPISHHDIGKYFEEFNGVRYIPNTMLSRLYPEDGVVPCDFLPTNPYDKMNENEPIDET